jgi:hypothetical protein
VINTVRSQCVTEGIGDLRLANEFGKRLWTIPTIKSVNHTWSLPGSTDDESGLGPAQEIFSACKATSRAGPVSEAGEF